MSVKRRDLSIHFEVNINVCQNKVKGQLNPFSGTWWLYNKARHFFIFFLSQFLPCNTTNCSKIKGNECFIFWILNQKYKPFISVFSSDAEQGPEENVFADHSRLVFVNMNAPKMRRGVQKRLKMRWATVLLHMIKHAKSNEIHFCAGFTLMLVLMGGSTVAELVKTQQRQHTERQLKHLYWQS